MELVCTSRVHAYLWFGHLLLVHSFLHVIVPLTQDGTTPLFIASERGHSDVVNVLIRNGADINLARNVYMEI